MNYRVVRIEEDVEFGCEERKEGDPVMVPVEVPCTSTDAPINGSLAASVTVPVTVFVCAKTDVEVNSRQTSVMMLLDLMAFF